MCSKQAIPHPASASAVSAPLTGLARLRVQGVDAADFLQRQTMNDVRALQHDGEGQWSGLLSAKGRVLYLFRLIRLRADAFLLCAPGADGAGLAAELGRFVLRSRVALEVDPQPARVWLGDPAPTAGGWHRWDAGRWLALGEVADTTTTAALDAEWQHLDTRRAIPWVDAALRDRYTPHMLALHRLHAFSLRKGCYPGQEVVARTHFLGQHKRQMQCVAARRPLQRGEAILDEGRTVGEVVQVSRVDPGLGLGVLPIPADSPRLADEAELAVLAAEPIE